MIQSAYIFAGVVVLALVLVAGLHAPRLAHVPVTVRIRNNMR